MLTPDFSDLLRLIEERSAALRAAAGDAGHDAPVPGCPDWSVRDLVAHLGEVQRFWAAVVAAGPGAAPPDDDQVPGREPSGDLIAWSAASTAELGRALREAGQERECWAWWQSSGAPVNAGAVARHQVQEAAVHAFDAQEAAGHPVPLPADVAADGVGEFLTVGMASMGAWPHEPGRVAVAAADGPTWLVGLDPSGARARQAVPGATAPEADAWLRGTASDLVLALYGRHQQASVAVEGDRELVTRLLAWAPAD